MFYKCVQETWCDKSRLNPLEFRIRKGKSRNLCRLIYCQALNVLLKSWYSSVVPAIHIKRQFIKSSYFLPLDIHVNRYIRCVKIAMLLVKKPCLSPKWIYLIMMPKLFYNLKINAYWLLPYSSIVIGSPKIRDRVTNMIIHDWT